jgi:hypothetical protein
MEVTMPLKPDPYTSQAAIQGTAKGSSGTRFPAQELEALVTSQANVAYLTRCRVELPFWQDTNRPEIFGNIATIRA